MLAWLQQLGIARGQEPWLQESLGKDYREVEFLSLDLELTSLNPKEGEILSIGYVPIVGGMINPAEGHHILISDHSGVGDSAVIHGIRDCDTHGGKTMSEALAELERDRQGKVLLMHHAGLDLSFLAEQNPQYGKMLAADTLQIEMKRRNRQGQQLAGALRLNQCRDRYNLPTYKAHNALTDALATAELFIAQMCYMGGDHGMSLKEVLRLSR